MNAGDGGPGPSNGASTSVTLVNSSSRSRVDAPQWEENRSHSIRIDALDLGRDYSVDKEPTASVKKQNKWRPLSPGKIKKTKEEEKASERGPRNKKWVNDEDEPMTDVKKLPKGWTMEEPDLDPDDISAQINRAKERIADDIMPFAFKWKLEYYRRIRRNQRRIKSRWPDTLSWQVVQRLESLRKIRRDLLQEDVYEQLPNVDAIIDRYTTGRLNWTGLVTYWHRGEQISQPRPFNWVEFEVINDHHNGKNGFWVEGLHGPKPETQMTARIEITPDNTFTHCHIYTIGVRLGFIEWWVPMEFLFDTGSSCMKIYAGDLTGLYGSQPRDTPVRTIGRASVHGALMSPEATYPLIQLEICLLDDKRKRLTQWVRTEALLADGSFGDLGNEYRLDGPCIRHLVYALYSPNGKNRLIMTPHQYSLHPPRSTKQEKREAPTTYLYPVGQFDYPVPPEIEPRNFLGNLQQPPWPKPATLVPK